MEEPVVIFIDASDYSVIVFCAECPEYREIHLHAPEAKAAGRRHQQVQHKGRGINTVTIHGE